LPSDADIFNELDSLGPADVERIAVPALAVEMELAQATAVDEVRTPDDLAIGPVTEILIVTPTPAAGVVASIALADGAAASHPTVRCRRHQARCSATANSWPRFRTYLATMLGLDHPASYLRRLSEPPASSHRLARLVRYSCAPTARIPASAQRTVSIWRMPSPVSGRRYRPIHSIGERMPLRRLSRPARA
jgi:hypothetical protein